MERKKNLKEVFDAFVELKTNPIEFLNSTTFKAKTLKLNSRVANHWAEKGLFPRNFEPGTWFVFNLTEAFWIKIITKLRDFNIHLEVIKQIKEGLFTEPEVMISEDMKDQVIQHLRVNGILNDEQLILAKEKSIWSDIQKIKLNYFERVILSILLERRHYFLLSSLDGKSILIEENQLLEQNDTEHISTFNQIASKSHIRISFNEILGDLVTTLGDLNCSTILPVLTMKEAKIIRLLREKSISKVEIRYNDDSEPHLIEITSTNLIDERSRLNDLIISRGYQEIIAKTQNGKIVHCENKIKYKLDIE